MKFDVKNLCKGVSDKERAFRILYIYIYVRGTCLAGRSRLDFSGNRGAIWKARARRAFYACETRTRRGSAAAQCPRGETRSGGRLLTRKPTRHPSIRGCRNAAAIAPRVNTSRHPTFTSVASRCCNEPRPLRAEEPKDGAWNRLSPSFPRFMPHGGTVETRDVSPDFDTSTLFSYIKNGGECGLIKRGKGYCDMYDILMDNYL